MNATITIAIIAVVIIAALVIAWVYTSNKNKAAFSDELSRKDADIIRKEADIRTVEALRENEKKQHEQAMAEIKASH